MRAQDTITKPTFDIPNLTEQQQKDSGLPADFWEAFDKYFGSADISEDRQVLAEHFGIDEADLEPVNPDEEYCWRINIGDDAAHLDFMTRTYDGQLLPLTHLRLTAPELIAAAENIVKVTPVKLSELNDIQHGNRPVWSFLPTTSEQLDHLRDACEAVDDYRPGFAKLERMQELARWAGFVGMGRQEIEGHFRDLGLPVSTACKAADEAQHGADSFEAAGGIETLRALTEHTEKLNQELADADYARGWPGQGTPPREEQS